MSKEKKSKLDPFAERLTQWFTPKDKGGDGLTLEQAQEQLALDGCKISTGRLSTWWESQQQEQLQVKLLGQIASGAQQCRAVEKQFGSNPAPELETLIKLHRVLILQLSTQGNANPEFLKLADQLMRTAMEFVSGQTKAAHKERELNLAETKFQRETVKLFLEWMNNEEAKKIVNSNAPTADKTERLGQKLFGDLWK